MLNSNLRQKIVQQAKADVLRFSSHQMAIETEKIYQEVLLSEKE